MTDTSPDDALLDQLVEAFARIRPVAVRHALVVIACALAKLPPPPPLEWVS